MADAGVVEDAENGVLYQEARWPWIARLYSCPLLCPLWVAAVVAVGLGRGLVVAGIAVLTTALVEWRARNMGVILTAHELVLVRALNRTGIPWTDIEGFDLIEYGTWGEQRLRVKRRGRVGPVQPAIPTLFVTPTRSHLRWWFQPARLRWRGGEIDDPVAFLGKLPARYTAPTMPPPA